MLAIILLSTLLILAVAILGLSAVGHLHIRVAALSEQVSDAKAISEWQARVTRKALVSELSKVEGYKQPEPTELERAMDALSRGEQPTIDLGTFARRKREQA